MSLAQSMKPWLTLACTAGWLMRDAVAFHVVAHLARPSSGSKLPKPRAEGAHCQVRCIAGSRSAKPSQRSGLSVMLCFLRLAYCIQLAADGDKGRSHCSGAPS